MYDKKNNVLFNDTECIVLSPNFKLIDESQVLLRVPRKNNMYSVDLKNIVPKGGLTCLFAKATSDESKLWHRRLRHINFKTMNKLIKGNLVRATKDETSGILKSFITGVENLIDQKVKIIRCDNGIEFKNKELNQFCKRKAEAVNTACYVQNRVLVTKPHNKTPYELFLGRKPALGFMRPFGCPVIILNTIDHLGKFDGKVDEGFFVGYSINSKAFRVFNSRSRIVKENLHVQFRENTPNIAGSGPNWLFDIDALTKSMNYKPVVAGNQSNGNTCTKACDDAGDDEKKDDENPRKDSEGIDQEQEDNVNSTNNVNAARHKLTTASETVEVQLQALVDGNKVIKTESTVRKDIQLEDADGVDCLHNATIFEQLTLMGYENISQKLTFYKAFFSPQWKFLIHTVLQCLSFKTTAWNEFSNTMAYAIICLATNQKFNFSKYIFKSMVKNLDNVNKILMYPRFVQVFLDKQLEGMATHDDIYIAPSYTNKIFGNMKRVGKGFSRRETPLFPTMMVQAQEEIDEGSAHPTDPHHTPTIIQTSTSQPQRKQIPGKPKRKDTEIPQASGLIEPIADEAVYTERDDSLERGATTAPSFDVEQDSGNINKTQSKATPNEPSFLGTSSDGGPRRQETINDTIAQTRSENVSKFSGDPLLVGVNTPQSGEDSLKLNELMELYTTLQSKVLALETTKTTQALEINSLKKRVKKLEKKQRSRTHKLKRLYKVSLKARVESFEDEGLGEEDASKQGRKILDIDADEDITLENVHDEDMFGVNDLDGDEVVVETEVASKDVNLSVDEVTLAQALAALKRAKPKAVKVAVHDKGKGKMVEPMKKLSKKDQLRLDEELAFKLQAKEEEEERLAIEKAQQIKEVNIAWDDVQAKIVTDYELAQRLQAKEQEELFVEEKATLFQQLLEKRRKHFAAKRAEEKRNRPQTKAQQRSIIIELVEGTEKRKSSSKRAGDELEQEISKKQKVDDDQETAELQSLMKVISNEEEVAVNVIPLATKPPSIVD
ncbi:ribonuclease H-like domain-containing protein [Tanacetum coccineum]|uniref:Ribonuclease H-like domain-containing protein n=1 Tax=Tanacetum coccineum TaxID=301880 RepID=A0ABQ5AEI5_9ASTR